VAFRHVKKWGTPSFEDVPGIKIVVSKNKNLNLPESYIVATSPDDALVKAESAGLKSVLLTGGSMLNSEFMKKNLIDEIALNIEPVLIGKGVPLFGESSFEKKLKLIEVKKIEKDILQLKYKVRKKYD